MRALIAGGGGFLGRAIIERLRASGVPVVVLDLPGRLGSLPGCDTAAFDFSTQPGEIARHARPGDRLVHLGCTSHPAASMDDPAADAESNLVASIRLFHAAAAAGVDRVVFASSGGTVYGRIDALPVDEEHPTRPLSAYGACKLAIENYLQLVPGLAGISLRVANPYGAGQLQGAPVGAIARFAGRAASGTPIDVWGDGRVVRDYIAVADVAHAFELAITHPELAPGAYNVGTGRGMDLNGILALLGEIAGHPLAVRHGSSRSYDVPAIVLDSTRFHEATGWSPAVALEQGIRDLWDLARRQGSVAP